MYELKKIGKVFTSKSVRTGASSYGKRIYRAAVSQRLRNTGLELKHKLNWSTKFITANNSRAEWVLRAGRSGSALT